MNVLPHNRKRSATPHGSPPASKRQNSMDRPDATQHSTSSTSEDTTASAEEHKSKLYAFMKPLVAELNEKVQRAYINDLEQQMSMELNAEDQRECAEFFHTILSSLDEAFFEMGNEWVEEIATEKPQGTWYRQWLDGNPDLFNPSKFFANGDSSKTSLPTRPLLPDNQVVDMEDSGSPVNPDCNPSIQPQASTPSVEPPTTTHLGTSADGDDEREKLTIEFARPWQERVQEEIVRQEQELKAKARVLGAKWEDLIIDGVAVADNRSSKDFARLQDDFFLTWKFRNLPLDNHEVDAWLEKRRRLVTFPRYISEDTMLQWTDTEGETHNVRASNVKLKMTEIDWKMADNRYTCDCTSSQAPSKKFPCRRCICSEFGFGCTTCRCPGGDACGNPFNNMERILGKSDSPLRAHDCFTTWLSNRGYKARPQPQDVNMKFIFSAIFLELSSYVTDQDPALRSWEEGWNDLCKRPEDDPERLEHMQELVRRAIVSDVPNREYVFSFCCSRRPNQEGSWVREKNWRHCNSCESCKGDQKGTWHCEMCNSCSINPNFPCLTCGGISSTYQPLS